MKTKSFKKVLGLCLGAAITLASCSPESPSNEKEHKLHEDPVRAVFTLQEGTLNGEGKFDAKPQISDFKSNGTPAQVIEYQTTEAEGWKITSTNADRKSTRLNSSHANISYAVFCLKKKK